MDRHSLAIIGAGPAGYTLAQELVKTNAFDIDIFDKEKEIGGAIYTGIPDYRMPKTFLTKAYEGLVENGVKFHFNTEVDHDLKNYKMNMIVLLWQLVHRLKIHLDLIREMGYTLD